MNHTKIKLCGLKHKADIIAANKLNPDYIGYIFAPERKRTITHEKALELTDLLNDNIIPVGVFKNNPIDEVIEVAKSGAISMIQLHGKEDEGYISIIREKLNIPIIKAFGIAWEEDIEEANKSIADFVLLDTPGGGTGFTFDHNLLDGIKRDYFLAGGLNPNIVADCISDFRPYAVDVSTGIETDGDKDSRKMEAFVNAVRNIDRSIYEK